MITFTDVKRTGENNTFFLPEPIKQRILHYLRQANIPYKSINWRKVPENTKPEQEKTRKQYAATGYDELMCIGAIISDVDPTDMFHKSLLFFGDTIDSDFKKQEEENKKEAWEMYKDYKKLIENQESRNET